MAEKTKKETSSLLDDAVKLKYVITVLVVLLGVSIYFNLQATGYFGAGTGNEDTNGEDRVPMESPFDTFNALSGDILMEDGKPVVFLFSTTTCTHCNWISNTFDAAIQEYINSGQIVAYHWNIDAEDNTLTTEVELGIPPAHMEIYGKLSGGYVPTFVFGGKYYRIGNAYERSVTSGEMTESEALQAEVELYKEVIEDMLSA